VSGAVRIHGTCVAVEGRGALFRGAAGAGKSDLALRLIERGAQLIADDQVVIEKDGDGVRAMAEPRLQGKLEVRGIGIVDVPSVQGAPLLAIFDLCAPEDVPRLPEPAWAELLPGTRVRVFRLAPFEASAPDKVRLTLAALAQL
jgi:hypothetical protein